MNSSAADPNIIDFLRAVGEDTSKMNRKSIKQCTTRKVLRLSAQWSHAVKTQKRRTLQEDKVGHFDEELDNVISTLTPDCALLEVNAMSLLSSLDASNDRSHATRVNSDDDNSNDDDDGMSVELSSLDESTNELRQELEAIRRKPSSVHQDTANDQARQSSDRGTIILEGGISLSDLARYGRSKISLPRFLQVEYS